jgi:hypothetical protein
LQYLIPSADIGAAFAAQGASSDQTVSSSANASGQTANITLAAGQEWLDENVGLTGIPA